MAVTGGAAIGASLPMMLRKKKEGIILNIPGNPVYGQIDGPYGYDYAIAGAVLIGSAIPFALATKKNVQKAIDIENGKDITLKPYFKLENSRNGIALSYNF